MYRDPLSAVNPFGLPAYLLWLMSQGMVFLAGLSSRDAKSYLPVMSRNSARDKARCQGYNLIGHVPSGQSEEGEDRRRDGRVEEEVYCWRTGHA